MPGLHRRAALVLVPFLTAGARADVDIPLACRVHNAGKDRAAWCALETLARHHKLGALCELVQKRTGPARLTELEAVLDEACVNHRIQDAGCRYTRTLRNAVEEKWGALVAFHELTPGAGRHFVLVVAFGPDEVKVLDPDDADGRVRTVSRRRFLSWWDGYLLVLEPDPAMREDSRSAPGRTEVVRGPRDGR